MLDAARVLALVVGENLRNRHRHLVAVHRLLELFGRRNFARTLMPRDGEAGVTSAAAAATR